MLGPEVIEQKDLNKIGERAIQQQSLKNLYDAVNVCIKPVQYTWATRSAFSYKCPVFAYVIIFTFD